MFARAPSIATALAIALAGCGEPEPVAASPAGIIGGSPDSSDPAVVLLVSYSPDQTVLATCTATLVAPDVLLTAAHCVDPATHPGYGFGAFAGPDASAHPTVATLLPHLTAAAQIHPHPDYDPAPPFYADIGVVVLEAPLGAAPLPIARALDASIVGAAARIVGYGQLVYGQYNAEKHQATTVVDALGAVDTVVVGDEQRRGCIGDSGGPALVELDGVETIVGVDSYTETTGCIEPAHYRRTDHFTDFIDAFVPPTSDGGGGGVAGSGGAGGQGASGGGDAGAAPCTTCAPAEEVSDDEGGGCAIGRTPDARRWPWALALALAGLSACRARRRRA
jgi:hypothetical protein